ncbi:MAG: hypothetical protein GY721_07170 [Deltaproteobacteria bacterium]|nr:hypothetical protein [Deltaproteobacteria bacterium]
MIEILVAIALMAIMFAIALPSFIQWSDSLNYREVSRDIVSKLRMGRQMAVTNNLEHRVEFDIDGRRYRLMQGNLSAGSTVWAEVRSWSTLDPSVNWATGGGCGGAADINLEFNPNGTADAGTICIQDNGGVTQFSVVVTATSGRVQIQ